MADDALEKKLTQDIGVRYAGMIADSVEVMAIADRTWQQPRNAKTGKIEQAIGVTDEEFNIYVDAMKSRREVPFYLLAHQARVQLAHRIAGDRAAAPQQIAKYVVKGLEGPKREYPVIDVTPKTG
jgi:hypothetical protein